MSDDPSSSTTAVPPQETETDTNTEGSPTDRSVPAITESDDDYDTPKARQLAQNKKREEFIRDILMKLDFLVYAELSTLYYLDCSFFRLIMRTLAQVVFLTPKPPYLPPMPAHRPYIGALIGTNAICIIFHLFTSPPTAGELTRGYLHGGLILDFIGQKATNSKVQLVLMDLLIMALQCFMLAVEIERLRLKNILSQAVAPSSEPQAAQVTEQDHDAEERGVIGNNIDESGDIEMQSMQPSRNTLDEEREQLLAEPQGIEDTMDNRHPLDTFFSGQAIVGEFHVLHTLQTQWDQYSDAIDRVAARTAATSISSAVPSPAVGRAMRTAQRNARLPAPLRRFMESRRQG